MTTLLEHLTQARTAGKAAPAGTPTGTPAGTQHPPVHEAGPAVTPGASKESIAALMSQEAKVAFPTMGAKAGLDAFEATKRGGYLATARDAAKPAPAPTPAGTTGDRTGSRTKSTPTKSAALAAFNRAASAAFPGVDLPIASVAYMELAEGRAKYAIYANADPDPVPGVAKSPQGSTVTPPGTKSAVFKRLLSLGSTIATREGISEQAAFVKALETDEGKRLHAEYGEAADDPVVEPEVAKAARTDPADIIDDTIVEAQRRIAKEESVSIPEADRILRASELGRTLYRGKAAARGLKA